MRNDKSNAGVTRAVFSDKPLQQPDFAPRLAAFINQLKNEPAKALKASMYGAPLEALAKKKLTNGKRPKIA